MIYFNMLINLRLVKCLVAVLCILLLVGCSFCKQGEHLRSKRQVLEFDKLPQVWDEAIPLGNGLTGALIWEKDGNLRITIDRADLWDLRPVKEFESSDYSYQFVSDQVVKKKDILPVWEMIDARTAKDPAPTKIPAGAIEFDISSLGEVDEVIWDVITATCSICWKNGAKARIFVPANEKGGRFLFEDLPDSVLPRLKTPAYEVAGSRHKGNTQLTALDYELGDIRQVSPYTSSYCQKAWGDVSYEIVLDWDCGTPKRLEGRYCIVSEGTWYSEGKSALECMNEGMSSGFQESWKEHKKWWLSYWNQSAIRLPDPILEKQWYLEMYKFGAASRKDAPPICLQAVWTADNGQIPPWRGDFHNDLNTQLSYWPGYASNHLEESSVFTDWLWKIRDNSRAFTQRFFKVEGLNVPCISTLEGSAIGGWNPYSHSPTAAGWLVHHFYLQWKYSMDSDFLARRAYPWVKEVACFFENVALLGEKGKYKLPISSSPEINDNRIEAWFTETTNYDLANIRFTYVAAAEMARELHLDEEAIRWEAMLERWPDYAVDDNGFMIAPGTKLRVSHRHLSHMLAFHPLGLIDISHGEREKELISKSVKHVEELGSQGWCGYTYAWLANMKARLLDGDGVVENLHIFIKAFCSPNSFHLNGDQLKAGYSGLTYRPFTLEGNFACAAAIQEMLLQSHTGVIRVFPAIPSSWKDVSFKDLRTFGAFLVSATMKDGEVINMSVFAEKGGLFRYYSPVDGSLQEVKMKVGEQKTII